MPGETAVCYAPLLAPGIAAARPVGYRSGLWPPRCPQKGQDWASPSAHAARKGRPPRIAKAPHMLACGVDRAGRAEEPKTRFHPPHAVPLGWSLESRLMDRPGAVQPARAQLRVPAQNYPAATGGVCHAGKL